MTTRHRARRLCSHAGQAERGRCQWPDSVVVTCCVWVRWRGSPPCRQRRRRPPSQRPAGEVRRYTRLGRTGLEISDISFGSARLRRGGERVVRHALDRGVNYFDTAEDYTGGASENAMGRALAGRRQEVVLVTKTMARADRDRDSLMRSLDTSLRRLRTDYIDVYFSHAVNDVERLKNPEWHEFVARAKEQGKIRFAGMSGHGGRLAECLDYALDRGHGRCPPGGLQLRSGSRVLLQVHPGSWTTSTGNPNCPGRSPRRSRRTWAWW